MNRDRKKELFGIQCDEIDTLENRITVLERLVELQKQEIANLKRYRYQPSYSPPYFGSLIGRYILL